MRLNETILILKRSDILKSKKGNSYFTISFADVTGEVFSNIMVNNIDTYDKFQPFNQVKAEIEIKNTLYGIKLQIMAV
jgi:hypothetical protein